MADKFQPNTFDIDDINNGNKFTAQDGITPEAINAPIESALFMQKLGTNQPDVSEAGNIGTPMVSIEQAEDGSPRFKFSNLGSKDHTEEIKEISSNIALLTAIAEQNEQFYKATIEEEFDSRITSSGLKVVNPSPATLKKVEGSTVKSKNLFDISKLSTTDRIINNGDGTIIVKKYASGTKETLRQLCPSLRAGDTATFSLITTATERPIITIYEGGVNKQWNSGESRVLTEDALDNIIWFYTNSVTDTTEAIISNIQIELGSTPTEYIPYFTGLKSASFKGIKSNGNNLFDPKSPKYSGFANVLNQENNEVTVSASKDGTSTYESANFELPNDELYIGKTIYISAKWSASANNKGLMRILWFNKDKAIVGAGDIIAYNSGTIASGIIENKPTKTAVLCVCLYANASGEAIIGDTVTYSDIMISFDNVAYSSYTENTLELPESIECGLGTIIDFENNKIVENGVKIVLNGQNDGLATRFYSYQGLNGAAFANILPEKEERVDNAVCIGATPTKNVGTAVKQSDMWIGVNDRGIYWLGILDELGYTNNWADKSNPTTEEKQQAISDFKVYLAQRYADGNPVTICYFSSTVQSETPFTQEQKEVGSKYTAWNKGTEIVLGNKNFEYGASINSKISYYILGAKPNE